MKTRLILLLAAGLLLAACNPLGLAADATIGAGQIVLGAADLVI